LPDRERPVMTLAMARARRALAGIVAVAVLGGSAVLAVNGATSPGRRYVDTWAAGYRTFAKVYVAAYRPCLEGATRECAAAQQLAATAAVHVASVLSSSVPPTPLAHDIARLERDLRAANRTLSASATAARAGQTSQRHWCSAEQGPCTVVMIDMGNVVQDIDFVAGVDLPLPG